jgi:anthranilate/para-aminobenzoate synthase component I
VRIGAGGAIVDLSDPVEEVAEVRLKAEALLGAMGGVLETGRARPDIAARRDAAL